MSLRIRGLREEIAQGTHCVVLFVLYRAVLLHSSVLSCPLPSSLSSEPLFPLASPLPHVSLPLPPVSLSQAVAAANRLRKIFPGTQSEGVVLSIPMPGHPFMAEKAAHGTETGECSDNDIADC